MQDRSMRGTTPAIRLMPLLLLLGVAGCAGRMGTLHPDPSAPPATTTFDGAYRSTIRVTGMGGAAQGQGQSWCQSPGQPMITVANGQFSYAVPHPNVPGNPIPNFVATVKQDGTFFGQMVDGTISGQITGSRMQGKIDGAGCLYSFTADRA